MISRRHFLHGTASGAALAALHPGLALLAGEAKSPFLEGNYGPVAEEVTHENLKVVGTLPKGLDGLFVRNGPNPQFAPKGRYHWFDGDGMVHGVRIRDGKADYRNRYVRTAGFEEEKKAGKSLYGGLMEPPDFKKLLGGDWKKLYKNVANTSLVWHDKKLLALWEGGDPHELKVPGLETVGPATFGGKLKHPFSAHPKIDPDTGDMLCFGYMPVKPFCVWSVVAAKGELVESRPVELPRPIMMHDFAVTKSFAVFLDLPMTFNFNRVAKGKPALAFEPDLPARIGLVSRADRDAKTQWFDIPACFAFHTLNAWDDGDKVVLLACRFPRFPGAIAGTADDEPNSPALTRWTLDRKTGKAAEEKLDDVPAEFPRVNESRLGRATRFGYVGRAEGDMFTGLRKVELATAKAEECLWGKGRFGGEGVFVPKPDGSAEDDGWLVAFVHDKGTDHGELAVVDAKDVKAGPVARVLVPARVPYGFHGVWVPGRDLA